MRNPFRRVRQRTALEAAFIAAIDAQRQLDRERTIARAAEDRMLARLVRGGEFWVWEHHVVLQWPDGIPGGMTKEEFADCLKLSSSALDPLGTESPIIALKRAKDAGAFL